MAQALGAAIIRASGQSILASEAAVADEKVQAEQIESTSGGSATLSAPTKKPAPPRRTPKKLPPYRVLLHNDDISTFEHVIQSIVMLTTLSPQEAVLRTLEAHEAGVSLLLTTHRERAELYAEQFASVKLTVTIEPAEK